MEDDYFNSLKMAEKVMALQELSPKRQRRNRSQRDSTGEKQVVFHLRCSTCSLKVTVTRVISGELGWEGGGLAFILYFKHCGIVGMFSSDAHIAEVKSQ